MALLRVEEAAFAASLGVDLIVTDHHLPHDVLPEAVAVVDPAARMIIAPLRACAGLGWRLSSVQRWMAVCQRKCWNTAGIWQRWAR